MSRKARIVPILVAFAVVFAHADCARKPRALDARLRRIMARYKAVGLSVAVVKGDALAFSGGYGMRDLERGLPVTEKTVYRIASISKTVATTALMILWERGAFRLEDDVDATLGFPLRNPRFPDDPITFERLLSHTSSLRDGRGYDAFLDANYNRVPPPALRSLLEAGGEFFTPDMFDAEKPPSAGHFHYANVNFGIIGTLVERLSGTRFDVFCRETIFRPLGLTASFNVQDLPDIDDVAALYRKVRRRWTPQADSYGGVMPAPRELGDYVVGTNGVIFGPQGGVRISANDLARFMIMLKNGGRLGAVRILGEAAVARMLGPAWTFAGSNGEDESGVHRAYGLGIQRTETLLAGETLAGHSGNAYGLISGMYFSRSGDYGVVFMTNGGVWGREDRGWLGIEKDVVKACVLALPGLSVEPAADRVLRYGRPAQNWNEALPVGNGRLGAMVFGGVPRERISFNEETLWTGAPRDYAHPGAAEWLGRIRALLFAGKPREAERLAMEHFMSVPLGQMAYQPFGDLAIELPGHEKYTDYERALDIGHAVSTVKYKVAGTGFTREVFASAPDRVVVIRMTADRRRALAFRLGLDSPHEQQSLRTDGPIQTLAVAVKGGALKGVARVLVETDGRIGGDASTISVEGAGQATIYLAAATNFVNYHDVRADPAARVDECLAQIEGRSFETVRTDHVADYRALYDRFDIDLGSSGRESLPMDERLRAFDREPNDPALLALYVQYGRYLLVASSRPGTQPANLQGLWNQDLDPAWGSKYTTNINAEMNYWPAELTNLAACHEPFFRMVEECAETGRATAKAHYGAEGWVLHHNTDLWRGTAPINHANHGVWLGGGGWVSRHLWEHYLFTRDRDFLRDRAWPVMREAARFYAWVLVPDPKTGRLISAPSNSPEIGGMVAGPTMDHQIIRSLFAACVEASDILGADRDFAAELAGLIPRIAPNRIGRLGQLQEWREDVDDPDEHHRHVSHLWGVHPGADITWERSPELMRAARQSLLFRGDEGTGWSLAWKINFWARFLDGDHAYELVKLLFRVKDASTAGGGGGTYINLFDAHPPFQIDGNFGGAAGIVELLVQSHQGFIDVLPALPKALPDGALRGVCARGGFELDLAWRNGRLTRLSVLSKAGEPCQIRYQGSIREFPTEKGRRYTLPVVPQGTRDL
jgi:alpha-L-fucosidase 2